VKTFIELVENYERTGFGCPDVYDLTLYDGSEWYVRLRHGIARLSPEGERGYSVSMDVEGDNRGIFDSVGHFKQVFMELAARHPDIDLTDEDDHGVLAKAAEGVVRYFDSRARLYGHRGDPVETRLMNRLRAALRNIGVDTEER